MNATLTAGLAALLIAGVGAQEPRGFDLRGEVVDTGGQVLEGATVFVYTAKPRYGTSPL